jgi:hypothetical protein
MLVFLQNLKSFFLMHRLYFEAIMVYFSNMKASTRQQEEIHIPPPASAAQKRIKPPLPEYKEKVTTIKIQCLGNSWIRNNTEQTRTE